jgi:hypothetical protein
MVKLYVICTWFIVVQRYGLLSEEVMLLYDLKYKFGPNQDKVSITNVLNCSSTITQKMTLISTPTICCFMGEQNDRSLRFTTDRHLATKSGIYPLTPVCSCGGLLDKHHWVWFKKKKLLQAARTEFVIQDDQNVSAHLMITILKTQSVCSATDRQGHVGTRLTLTLSVIPNSNYVTMVSDWNCLKYVCVFFVL